MKNMFFVNNFFTYIQLTECIYMGAIFDVPDVYEYKIIVGI